MFVGFSALSQTVFIFVQLFEPAGLYHTAQVTHLSTIFTALSNSSVTHIDHTSITVSHTEKPAGAFQFQLDSFGGLILQSQSQLAVIVVLSGISISTFSKSVLFRDIVLHDVHECRVTSLSQSSLVFS